MREKRSLRSFYRGRREGKKEQNCEINKTIEYIATVTVYLHGYFYKCVNIHICKWTNVGCFGT